MIEIGHFWPNVSPYQCSNCDMPLTSSNPIYDVAHVEYGTHYRLLSHFLFQFRIRILF